MNVPNYKEIEPYIEKKLVSMQRHPDHREYAIFNYTQVCQFEQAWDDITRQCRGLILDLANEKVVARPFPKFFNYGEHVTKGWAIPTTVPVVTEKYDGSLGILYKLHGKPWIATRGSFISDQAIWATQWWREHVGILPEDGETNLFEIIYPENRIVVNYNFSGLMHLATIRNSDGLQISKNWHPIDTVKTISFSDIRSLEKMETPNSEGFVLFYPEENIRMKIKFPEYVRLHKLITGVSEIAIWEHLRDGNNLDDLLEKVPDEFFKWVKYVQLRLISKYKEIEDDAKSTANESKDLPNRKEQAIYIQKNSKNPGISFAMLDGKNYEILIWRMIRPHGKSSFKVDIDL